MLVMGCGSWDIVAMLVDTVELVRKKIFLLYLYFGH